MKPIQNLVRTKKLKIHSLIMGLGFLFLSGLATSETINLECAWDKKNSESLVLNEDRGLINFFGESHPAKFTSQSITWNNDAYGEVALITLNRYTGILSTRCVGGNCLPGVHLPAKCEIAAKRKF